VLALQGDYEAHARALCDLGVRAEYVTRPEQLREIDSLILPGGESTTMVKLIEAYDFRQTLLEFHRRRQPIFGTCAGLILLAGEVSDHPEQMSLGCIDTGVARNAYGRQIESFETRLHAHRLGEEPLPAVFIRAPRIVRAGSRVEVLARLDGDSVLVRQENVLAASFHPELTPDRRVHRFFLELDSPGTARRAA
jgi:5'-phosphate synthase pdxT subunit